MEERLNICKKCPICDLDNMVCNPRLYIDPSNDNISTYAKEGYIKGCGCDLLSKTKNANRHCPAEKW